MDQTDIITETLEAIFNRKSNVIDIRSGASLPQPQDPAVTRPDCVPPARQHNQVAPHPELRRQYSERLAQVAVELDALYAESKFHSHAEEALRVDVLLLDGMAYRIAEMMRTAKVQA